MKMLNNFLKKFNNPVPVFAQTKMEKETQNEDASSTKPKTTFIDVAGLDEVKEELKIKEEQIVKQPVSVADDDETDF